MKHKKVLKPGIQVTQLAIINDLCCSDFKNGDGLHCGVHIDNGKCTQLTVLFKFLLQYHFP